MTQGKTITIDNDPDSGVSSVTVEQISPDAGLLSLAPSWNSNTNTWAEETKDWEYGLEPDYTFGTPS